MRAIKRKRRAAGIGPVASALALPPGAVAVSQAACGVKEYPPPFGTGDPIAASRQPAAYPSVCIIISISGRRVEISIVRPDLNSGWAGATGSFSEAPAGGLASRCSGFECITAMHPGGRLWV